MEKEVFNKKLKENKTERHYDLITFFDAANLLKSEFNASNDKKNFDKDELFKKYFEERNQARLLFTLKQGDFVYLPNDSEDVILDKLSPLFTDYWRNISDRSKNVYVVQKFSGNRIYFLKHTIADSIAKKVEFGSQDCYEKIGEKSIKEFCFKINSDRLGNISNI